MIAYKKVYMLGDCKVVGLNLAERFASVSRDEHRDIRDTLFALIRGFEKQDIRAIASYLRRTLDITGPHFRYEEESVFPALIPLFGDTYVDRLLTEHDIAIGIAIRIDNVAAQPEISPVEGSRMAALIRGRLLPQVSDCDGLSIMVERLPEETIARILQARDLAISEGFDLFSWATQIRKRPAVFV